MSKAQHTLCVLANALSNRINVAGIQLLNEPQNHGSLPGWYASTIDAMNKIAPGLPLYIHDAWSTQQYADFANGRREFVVVDHHLYRCFTQDDQHFSGDEHASNLLQNFSGTLAHFSNSCRGNLVVAEFSAALNPASLRSGEAGEQDRQRRVFARAELDIYERHCAGWYFWCYKKDGWDAGWSLRDTVVAEIMPSWVGLRKSEHKHCRSDYGRRDVAKDKALGRFGFFSFIVFTLTVSILAQRITQAIGTNTRVTTSTGDSEKGLFKAGKMHMHSLLLMLALLYLRSDLKESGRRDGCSIM